MAACIDSATWAQANAICKAAGATVNGVGLGIWGKRRRTAVSGLGILGDINSLNVQTMSADVACGIAAQPICPPTAKPLVGYCKTYPNDATCQPGGKTYCATYKTDPKCLPKVDSLIPVTTTAPATTKTAGFSTAGLLAILAAGGFVIYEVMKHKKASG